MLALTKEVATVRIPITVLALVLGGTLAAFATDQASAHEPHPGLNFSISVDGVRDCNTRHGDANCAIPPGETFIVKAHLDALPDDIPSYGGFDILLIYEGVTPLQDADTSVWPDCVFPATYYALDFATFEERPDIVAFGCAIGVPPAGPATYAGTIGKNSFVCHRSGRITLLHNGISATALVEPSASGLGKHSEGQDSRETLNITCSDVLPTRTSAAPGLPSTGQHPSGTPPPFWLIASFLGTALVVACALRLRRAAG
jgi:hypothetical protein